MADALTTGRGHPWEFDPGPPRNRKWPRLFAETPNYRGIGAALSGEEEHRWHFGPMFYRGRLQDNAVKVLILGQEGAQDESLSHRSFTGGTGGRMQHVLHHLGITESYLFLNTFVYPIFGQYNGLLPVIAQDPASPVAIHRGRLLDYALQRNDIRLIIAVGRAAKESVSTLVQRHGGQADPAKLHLADAHVLGPNVRTVGVLHPGGASRRAQRDKIINDFTSMISQVATWESASPGWLPTDEDGTRKPAADFEYKADPIPFRDFPYGTNWRLGRGGTSSNRFKNQEWIQLFGADGQYADFDVLYPDQDGTAVPDATYEQDPGDLPYEPAREEFADFDPGPKPAMARLLQGGAHRLQWPDFTELGLRADPSLGHGPIYRGRPDDASVLVIADQQSHDDLFTGRALCGNVGQHLQAFLRAAGITERYAILRTLPVDTLSEDPLVVDAAIDDPQVRAILRQAINRVAPQVIITLGDGAARVAADERPGTTPVINLPDFPRSRVSTKWKPALTMLRDLDLDRDVASPTFMYGGEREPIPRGDLPYGTLRWQGSHGDRAQQGVVGDAPSPSYFRLRMPTWVMTLPPSDLTSEEHSAVETLRGAR